jgi:hypothetical protein
MKMALFPLALFLFFQSSTPPVPSAPKNERQSTTSSSNDIELGTKLLKIKRIYVDSFGDDNSAKQLQSMVINALSGCKRFIVTENKDKADAVLKGSALEKTSKELHAIGEGTAAAGGGGSSGGFGAKAAAMEDSQASTETINDARLAVRLVDTDGDVIWTTTQESKGAKYKGSSADVADKIVKQLLRDLEKLAKKPDQPASQ